MTHRALWRLLAILVIAGGASSLSAIEASCTGPGCGECSFDCPGGINCVEHSDPFRKCVCEPTGCDTVTVEDPETECPPN